jgi:cell division protein FtsA
MGALDPTGPRGRGDRLSQISPDEGRLVGALDLGASKIVALIGRVVGADDIALLGVGAQKPQAGQDGGPLDFDACVRAMRIAVDHAERMAGETISSVVTAFGGPGLKSHRLAAAIALPPGPISATAARASIAASLKQGEHQRRTALHAIPAGYRVDGGPLVSDPRGFEGRSLSAEMIVVTAPEAAVEALMACIAEAGLRVARVVASPYAAGLAVLSPEERAIGAIAMECGAGHVGVAAFYEGGLILADQSPIGGAALTSDIAARIGAPFAAAERLKIAHGGFGRGQSDTIEAARLGPEGRLEGFQLARASLMEAFAPRLEEMLISAGERLEPAARYETAKPWRLALTGGASLLPGIRDVAQTLLVRPARLARPVGFGVLDDSPSAAAYAVAAGLLRYEGERPPEAHNSAAAEPAQRTPRPESGAHLSPKLGKAWDWFKENF